ncbi:MAG TPA: NAD(P)-dependent alcohol dehydrogenase [Thermoanaerobaculia bacterium]|nr:NAD(P)-dependent alcohol dehydrogenase [Thermoanaerobaculia bacterium]
MLKTQGYAAWSPATPLAPFDFERREPGPHDVQIEILFCGVCHSDLHAARGEWNGIVYPLVPGHEIVGRVIRTGGAVSRFRPGDLAAVGVLVDSCQRCASCAEGLEQYCENGATETYGSIEKETGRPTNGGYSDKIVVNEKFVLRLSAKLDPAAAAPLLCAGITTWSPLRHWQAGPGHKVGVVGLGGLGHMAVKLAHALGAHVVLFTTSPAKTEDARRLGADEVVLSTNPAEMAKHASTFHLILDTAAAPHDLDAYLALLKRDGALVLVGLPGTPHPSPAVSNLILHRRTLAGSSTGGIAETQEMLDFCAEHGIASDVEIIPIQRINEAYDRMLKGDVRYRFVIEMGSLREGANTGWERQGPLAI